MYFHEHERYRFNYTILGVFVTATVLKAFYLCIELDKEMCDNNTERINTHTLKWRVSLGKSRS